MTPPDIDDDDGDGLNLTEAHQQTECAWLMENAYWYGYLSRSYADKWLMASKKEQDREDDYYACGLDLGLAEPSACSDESVADDDGDYHNDITVAAVSSADNLSEVHHGVRPDLSVVESLVPVAVEPH